VPTIATGPLEGFAGSPFVRWGDGFTPNKTASLFFYKPNGEQYFQKEITLTSEGTFEFTDTLEAGMGPGVYSWKAVDNTTKREDIVSFTILKGDSEQKGLVFLSYNYVSKQPVYFNDNFGINIQLREVTGFSITFEKIAVAIHDVNNNHLIDFAMFDNVTIPANGTWDKEVVNQINSVRSPGEYRSVVKGKMSDGEWFDFDIIGIGVNPFIFKILPRISQEPDTVSADQDLYQKGSGFTPNGNVTFVIKYPDGNTSHTEPYKADEQGNIDTTYHIGSNKQPGYYTWRAVDDSTGTESEELSYCVVANLEMEPLEGNPGTEFTIKGTGFTPNSNVELHFWAPDYSEYATQKVDSNAEGKFNAKHTFPNNLPGGNYWVTATDVWWSNNPYCHLSTGGDFSISGEVEQPDPSELKDSDEDGLPDDWELNGINGVNLPAMGADPYHKDVFVEIDYMQGTSCDSEKKCNTVDYKPSEDSINQVIDSFEKAGIRLHVDMGSESVDRFTQEKWGDLSRSNAIPSRLYLTDSDLDRAIEEIKENNFDEIRRKVFRYCLIINRISPERKDTSGISRTPGTNIILAAQAFRDEKLDIYYTQQGPEQTGTFMHELGHSLGLNHWGITSEKIKELEESYDEDQLEDRNYKPNFLSVMNYSFQMTGLIKKNDDGTVTDGYFDYSSFEIGALDENDLDESVGLKSYDPMILEYGTRYVKPGTEPGEFHKNDKEDQYLISIYPAGGPINWNGNEDGQEKNITADINCDGQTDILFETVNEWDSLIFKADSIGALNEGASIESDKPFHFEMTQEEYLALPRPYRVLINGDTGLALQPSGSGSYTLTVINTGTDQDSYKLESQSENNWIDLSDIPDNIILNPGESKDFDLNITIPHDADLGNIRKIIFRATSKGNPRISDSHELYLKVTEAGDANGDGRINICDLNVVDKFLKNIGAAPGYPDANQDGEINTYDFDTILSYIQINTNLLSDKFPVIDSGLKMNTVTAQSDSLVTIPISFINTPQNLCGIQFDIVYNDASLKFNEILKADATSGFTLNFSQPESGRLRVIIYPPAENPLPRLPSSDIAQLKMKVSEAGGLKFENVIVSDNIGKAYIPSDIVNGNISISSLPDAPSLPGSVLAASAGPSQTVAENTVVTLHGSAINTTDPNITYRWVQISGPAAENITGADTAKLTFHAPEVGQDNATLTFQLTVTDSSGTGATAATAVTSENHGPGDEGSGCFLSTLFRK